VTPDIEKPVRVLRVFTDTAGLWGNSLGVVDDGRLVAESDRQRVAHELGFSETIFIDDRATGVLRIFTPAVELPLAGHPLVGAAWLLGCESDSSALLELRPPGGLVRAWSDDDNRTWIDAPLASLPDWTLVQLGSPVAIDDLSGPLQPEHDHVVYWAWVEPGVVRMRCFAPKFGITEDEATGSAALRLATALDQPIEIRQGKGSVLCAHPIDSDRAAVGGLVVEDQPLRLP
jgi:predicted PhzF superfamily epimerase YddE/YHI9